MPYRLALVPLGPLYRPVADAGDLGRQRRCDGLGRLVLVHQLALLTGPMPAADVQRRREWRDSVINRDRYHTEVEEVGR